VRRFWLALALGLAFHATAQAQQLGASRTVLGTVTDNRNKPIVEFGPDDFVVREAGQLREVLSVGVADYPIAVVLDNGAGSSGDFEAIRKAASRFVGRVGHRPIAVAIANPPQLVSTFDDERAVVLERIEALTPGPSAGGVFQAIVGAARAILETGTPFSAIVVLTSGSPEEIPDELVTPILESGAAVHVVLSRAVQETDAQSARAAEVLRTLASQTRGHFTTIYTSASYQAALDSLADRMAPEIMIEYLVPQGSPNGSDVQLGVRIPGARVNGLGVSSR
jgi:hypothetical protein